MKRMMFVAALAVLTASSGWSQTGIPKSNPLAKSIPGTVKKCNRGNLPCEISITVKPSAGDACIASVDIETVKIKKNLPFAFVLFASAADPARYTFYGQGIIWEGTPPGADVFEFVGLTNGDTAAAWQTKSKRSASFAYRPTVKRSDGVNCDGADPKIANDGS